MKIIKRFVLGDLKTNCYLITNNDKVILIDAGCHPQKVIDTLKNKNLTLDYILITHTHYDHIGGLDVLIKHYPCACVVVNKKEQAFLQDPQHNLSILDNLYYQYKGKYITYDQLDLAQLGISIFEISGHSLASVCIYFKDDNVVFSGDTLFKEVIGRSDFIDGNEYLLQSGIKKHLLTLPPQTKVYPGHGFSTTIAHELNNNKCL